MALSVAAVLATACGASSSGGSGAASSPSPSAAATGPYRATACTAALGSSVAAEDLTFTGAMEGHQTQACGQATCATEENLFVDPNETEFVAEQIDLAFARGAAPAGPTPWVLGLNGWAIGTPPFTVAVSSVNIAPNHGGDASQVGKGYAYLNLPGSVQLTSTGGSITFTTADHGTADVMLSGTDGSTVHVAGSFATTTPCATTGL